MMSNFAKDPEQIIVAILQGDVERVRYLINNGYNPNESLDEALVTPLHYAAQHNKIDIAMLLIENGANTYACTKDEHYTPLSLALLFGHMKLAQMLLAYMHPTYNEC
jgi:ankyrin repeat protein